jgi:hypothetical protein
METEHWLAVADEIRQDLCRVRRLVLLTCQVTRSVATEAVKAIASAIREDHNLEHLTLQMENGFTDEAGVALAEALTVNKTLCTIDLIDIVYNDNVDNKAALGASAYEAFNAMLRVNSSLSLYLPAFDAASADERLLESRHQMNIEEQLNYVGRGSLLSSSQTTRKEWVDALNHLNEVYSSNVDNSPASQDNSPALNISSLYSLLLLNPGICSIESREYLFCSLK